MGVNLLCLDQRHAINFVAWCYRFTSLNSGLTSKALTAATSYHKDNGISFDRKRYPAIKRHLDGYKHLRPPSRRGKLPFSDFHIEKMFCYCINKHRYDDVKHSAAVLLGKILLLRPGEISFNTRTPRKRLTNGHIVWFPSFSRPLEISIKVERSKTNRFGEKLETIYAPCICQDLSRIIPCLVHYPKYWITVRNTFYGCVFDKNDFLFINTNRSPYRYDSLNQFMSKVILNINSHLKLNMNPHHYTPHSLRLGGCTDMVRYGRTAFEIEQKGRWGSQMWRYTYVNMNWRDMANLEQCTVSELLKNITHKPYA